MEDPLDKSEWLLYNGDVVLLNTITVLVCIYMLLQKF